MFRFEHLAPGRYEAGMSAGWLSTFSDADFARDYWTLPPGTVLVLVPTTEGPQRAALQATARYLAAAGHRVTTVAAEQVLRTPGIQGQLALG